MSDTPIDDQPGFVTEKPEHCFACFRLIRPGQMYHMTINFEVLCEDCALSEVVTRMREDLAVEVKRDRLIIQRGNAEVEVFPNEIRHLVNALCERLRRLKLRPPGVGLLHLLDRRKAVRPTCRIPETEKGTIKAQELVRRYRLRERDFEYAKL